MDPPELVPDLLTKGISTKDHWIGTGKLSTVPLISNGHMVMLLLCNIMPRQK